MSPNPTHFISAHPARHFPPRLPWALFWVETIDRALHVGPMPERDVKALRWILAGETGRSAHGVKNVSQSLCKRGCCGCAP